MPVVLDKTGGTGLHSEVQVVSELSSGWLLGLDVVWSSIVLIVLGLKV